MIGIGIDIVAINRMAETIERSGDIFLRRVFTPTEIESGKRCDHPAAFFAMAFAAKEAVFKALTLSWEQGIDLRHIEINRGEVGQPLVRLSGQVERAAKEKGCGRVEISQSFETDMAVAVAIAVEA
ncbi:MAG: holo-ACP synthase [Anaerolineales bacterium]|nr:holo-ACP synthase [Anaerolineales bacterium]